MSDEQTESGLLGKAVIGALVAGLLAAAIYQGVQEAKRAQLVEGGASAPSFELERLEGGKISLSELKGKVVMLDFWATWCPPCIEEMPSLVKLAAEYESKGLVFVAANSDDPDTAREAVEGFVQRRVPGLRRHVAFTNAQTSDAFKVHVLPTVYFLDRHGKVIDAKTGSLSEGALRRNIERALETP